MEEFNQELFELIKQGTTSFTCTSYIKDILIENGYQELKEKDKWILNKDKYFVIRNDASIIAFHIPKKKSDQFKIVCTHADTPSLAIKPSPEYYEHGYQKLNVAPYGGLLNYGFMDRPMSIAGRIITKHGNTYKKEIIDVKESVAIIPSIAIHQNDKANSNLDLNTQIDLMPMIALDKDYSLEKLLKERLHFKGKLFDFDLFLYNCEEPKMVNQDFIASPRIDNLTCTYAALKAFINNLREEIGVLAVFNNEEIGSNTYEGADSNFLIDSIKRICIALELDLPTTLANSFIISADNTHARHPSHDELSDHTNTPILNEGILIMKEMNGTTNGVTSTIFKHICESKHLTYMDYTSRNDFATGSTLAGASLRHLSIHSLDIGLPMLAMHSGLEVIGSKDTYYLYQALEAFYQTRFEVLNNKIIFK